MKRDNGGYTVTETLVAAALLSLVMAAGFAGLWTGSRVSRSGIEKLDEIGKLARLAEHLKRALRFATRLRQQTTGPNSEELQIQFVDEISAVTGKREEKTVMLTLQGPPGGPRRVLVETGDDRVQMQFNRLAMTLGITANLITVLLDAGLKDRLEISVASPYLVAAADLGSGPGDAGPTAGAAPIPAAPTAAGSPTSPPGHRWGTRREDGLFGTSLTTRTADLSTLGALNLRRLPLPSAPLVRPPPVVRPPPELEAVTATGAPLHRFPRPPNARQPAEILRVVFQAMAYALHQAESGLPRRQPRPLPQDILSAIAQLAAGRRQPADSTVGSRDHRDSQVSNHQPQPPGSLDRPFGP